MDVLNANNLPPEAQLGKFESPVVHKHDVSPNYRCTINVHEKSSIDGASESEGLMGINSDLLEDRKVNELKSELMDSLLYSDGALQVQLKEIEKDLKFFCCYCPKHFAKKQQLQNHIKTHTKEKNFKCDRCNKSFVHKQQLTNHEKTHTGKKDFKCSYCNKCFILKQQMQIHLKIHTGEKNFICNMCDKSFITKQQLQNHVNSHLGIKPFSCNVCSKNFAHKQQLLRHEKRHDKQVHFCVDCNVKFESKDSLAEHINGEHKFCNGQDMCNTNSRWLRHLL